MTRKITNRLIEMMDMGALDPINLAMMCLKYMSESNVTDMARLNGLNELINEEEDDNAA